LSRNYHTATLIGRRLYILGGKSTDDDDDDDIGKEFFYQDFSKGFNTQELLWNDLTSINTVVPSHNKAVSGIGGDNNNTLFLYLGRLMNENLVFTFDAQSNLWSKKKIMKLQHDRQNLSQFRNIKCESTFFWDRHDMGKWFSRYNYVSY
jgi:hypothetical protein